MTAEQTRLCGPASWRVLDVSVNDFTEVSLMVRIAMSVRQGRQTLIANHNVNSLALCKRDEIFREFYDHADYVFIDGAPVVGLARLSGSPASMRNRVGVLDWIWSLLDMGEMYGWRIVHLGSTTPVIDRAVHLIRTRHPSLKFTCVPGFFDLSNSLENRSILRVIAEKSPDILLVGMGMPRQEKWVLENLSKLPDCVIITVGGIIGYLGGDRPTAPRWLGGLGAEWLFRLVTEPRRLWRRYLVEPLVLWPRLREEAARRIFKRRSRNGGI